MDVFDKKLLQAERGRQIFSKWGLTPTTADTFLMVLAGNVDMVRAAVDYLPEFKRRYYRRNVYVIIADSKYSNDFLLAGATAVLNETPSAIESVCRYMTMFSNFGMAFQIVILTDDDRFGANKVYPLENKMFSIEEYVAVGLYRLNNLLARHGEKVSIIVPVYNTEDYLDRCISSLVRQTYENIEILLINDGSTDGSGNLCRKWAEKDSRIVYIEQENAGQGVARTKGIMRAEGEYIIFVDSDDFIELDLVSEAYKKISELDADVCIYTHNKIDAKGQVYPIPLNGKFQGKKTLDENPLLLGEMYPLLWLGLYRSEILKSLDCGMQNIMCEDLLYLSQVYLNARRGICTLDKCLYNYNCEREGNLSTTFERYGEVLESVGKMKKIFQNDEVWEKYKYPVYIRTFEIFKDFYRRFHNLTSFRMPLAIRQKWTDCAKNYYTFLENEYGKYFNERVLRKNILTIGSVNLSRICQNIVLEDKYLLPDYTDTSIVSLMSMEAECMLDLSTLTLQDPYGNRQLRQDVAKTLINEKEYENADVIVVDLLCEIADILEVEPDCYITEGIFMRILCNSQLRISRRVPFLSGEKRQLFQYAVQKFAELMKANNKRIVLVENYLTEEHKVPSGEFALYANLDEVHRLNDELKWYYECFCKYNPNAVVVEMDEECYTDDSLGAGWPLFYNTSYNWMAALKILEKTRDDDGQ